MDLTDVGYEVEDGLAWITIERPERMNAFRARTVDELIHCFKRAWASGEVGAVCLTGAGDRARRHFGGGSSRSELIREALRHMLGSDARGRSSWKDALAPLKELEAQWVGRWNSTDIVRYYRETRHGRQDRR